MKERLVIMEKVLYLPFYVVKAPDLKLKKPKWVTTRPSIWVIYGILVFSYFLVTSGIIYDIIMEPPSMGTSQEGGGVKPIAFMAYRVNGQFIIEGLSAGGTFVLGAFGIILIDYSNGDHILTTYRMVTLSMGTILVVSSFILGNFFIRLKIPGYLKR